LDGTLVNSYEADYLAYRDAVREVMDTELDRDGYMALHGMEIGAKLARLMPDLTPTEVDGIRAAKKRHYYDHVHLTKLNAPLVSFLEQFPHLALVLVTTAKKDNVAAVMGQHDLAKYFTLVVTGDDLTRFKPDPQAYQIALERSGLGPHEVIAFEDSPSGIASAEAAGIQTVRVREFAAS
jgi:HAD superfamily hydrolase (TIGR01509 family)